MTKNFIQTRSRPTWVEINLKNLAHNFHAVRKWVGKNTAVMGIVKADAYGHGAVETAKALQKEGIDFFAVASLDEAKEIYDAGITKPILILGYTPPECLQDVVKCNFRQTVFDIHTARKLNHAAQQLGKTARIHIKIDTGMGRLGLFPAETMGFIHSITKLPGMNIDGIFTHFSSADEDVTYTKKQLAKFNAVILKLQQERIFIPYKHAANSAGLITMKESYLNMVRPGILLYGLTPLHEKQKLPFPLKPVLSLKTRIISLKPFSSRAKISYSGRYLTKSHENIAVVPIGYADGYLRALSNKSHMLVRGKKAPVVGQVCMDFTLLNVTEIPGAKMYDKVTVIGQSKEAAVTVNELAHLANTINYEITCLIGKRIPRVYL